MRNKRIRSELRLRFLLQTGRNVGTGTTGDDVALEREIVCYDGINQALEIQRSRGGAAHM